MSLEEIARWQRQIVDAWWDALPRDGWTLTFAVWSRVVESTMREIAVIHEDGTETFVPFPESMTEAIVGYREALADPHGGGWPIAFQMRMNGEGEAQMRVVWNDQVWFGLHPGAPLQPPTDPTADVVPTPEMWRLELEMHPRAQDAIPDWWRFMVDGGQGAPSTSELDESGAQRVLVSRDEALASEMAIPGSVQLMDGAWGWDRLVEEVHDAVNKVVAASAHFDEAPGQPLEQSVLDDLTGEVIADLRSLHSEWPSGTPIRLLREWNERHGLRDPEGLGEVDPQVRVSEAAQRSLPLKNVMALLDGILLELGGYMLRVRCTRHASRP